VLYRRNTRDIPSLQDLESRWQEIDNPSGAECSDP